MHALLVTCCRLAVISAGHAYGLEFARQPCRPPRLLAIASLCALIKLEFKLYA
jgi:hypothetical protein